MKKICFVIGSTNYTSEALPNLLGCQPDAQNIFDALTDGSIDAHDKEASRLLISPTLEEVRNTFDEIFEANINLDVFTFAFSGHGGVKTGNLFLCLKNTNTDRLSMTALPLSFLFTILNEAAPRQTNIIIDACESGGVVFDLRNIINPELLGAKETPGVSILASAASDQSAKETPEGGYASTALVQCLRGEVRVQTHRPYLNLVEVGNAVSKIVSDTVLDQTPVVWGLNLFGDSFLANNPHFEGDVPPYSYKLAQIPAGSDIGQVLQDESQSLWKIYQSLPERIEFRALLNAIHQPCEKLGAEKGVVSSFIRGLSQSIPSQAANQNDEFAEVQAFACCVVALLAFLNVDEEAEDTILKLITELSDLLQGTLEKSYEAMADDPFALLSNRGGTNDLFFLPIRISKLLGWAAAHTYICNEIGINKEQSIAVFRKITNLVVTNYLSSVVAVSDCQSPFLLCAFSELQRNGLNGEAETIFGSIFNSYIQNKGLVADAIMPPKLIPDFLLRRNSEDFSGARDIYAQPDEMLSVIFHVAIRMGLDDVIDPYLEQIDHHVFNVFIPNDYTQFGAFSIRNGINATFQIGYEKGLGVFRTSDFQDGWEKSCTTLLNVDPSVGSKALKITILLAAFLYPDRVPWLTFFDQ